jgi:tetratricopeptide (TPR) repeat protein
MEIDRGDPRPEHVELAEQFLQRAISMWPDSLAGREARLSRADLYIVLARYEEALADVDALGASGRTSPHPGEIPLLRGEILAHGLGRYAEAESIFAGLMRTNTGTRLSRAASLDLAVLLARRGETRAAIKMLRDLELADETPIDTRTTAMILRALIVGELGDWGESVTLLWRICRLYPFTRAGMVAPLLMLRHELAARNLQTAASIHRKAAEFYVDAIERDSASLRFRHLVFDYLIESYLLVGDPKGAATLLEEKSNDWDGENGAVGLIKSALIYLNLLDDRENGVRMLEKCLDLFPASRYAGIVRARLDSLSHRQTVQ